jgi:hypothetical protein
LAGLERYDAEDSAPGLLCPRYGRKWDLMAGNGTTFSELIEFFV